MMRVCGWVLKSSRKGSGRRRMERRRRRSRSSSEARRTRSRQKLRRRRLKRGSCRTAESMVHLLKKPTWQRWNYAKLGKPSLKKTVVLKTKMICKFPLRWLCKWWESGMRSLKQRWTVLNGPVKNWGWFTCSLSNTFPTKLTFVERYGAQLELMYFFDKTEARCSFLSKFPLLMEHRWSLFLAVRFAEISWTLRNSPSPICSKSTRSNV